MHVHENRVTLQISKGHVHCGFEKEWRMKGGTEHRFLTRCLRDRRAEFIRI